MHKVAEHCSISQRTLPKYYEAFHEKKLLKRSAHHIIKTEAMGSDDVREDTDKSSSELNESTKIIKEKQNNSKNKTFRKKVYTPRNSVLTDLMEVIHLQTVYNIWVATFILFFFSHAIYYRITPKMFWRDMIFISNAISNGGLIVKMLVFYIIFGFLIFYGFQTWIWLRNKINKMLADLLFLFIYISSLGFLFVVPAYLLFTNNSFSIFSNLFIMMEQMRTFMKVHSFVRENAPRVLQYKPSKDGQQEKNLYPPAMHYLYFLYIPATIYKDSYPRKKEINYRFITKQFLTLVAIIIILCCIYSRLMVDIFQDVGTKPFTMNEAIRGFAASMIFGSLVLFLFFYGLLHSWMNLFAELFRFADREFYQDWWNSTNYYEFFKKWNTVVYDWLHTYVYMDLKKMGFNRSLSLLVVIVFSGVIHEYALSLILGYFYPVLGVMYLSIVVRMLFVTKNEKTPFWNIYMWINNLTGLGFIMFFYCLESFARGNCKSLNNPIQDFFIPRSWSNSCHIIAFS